MGEQQWLFGCGEQGAVTARDRADTDGDSAGSQGGAAPAAFGSLV